VIDDPDIYRAAKLVMDQRGEEAATFAGDRAAACDFVLTAALPGSARRFS